MVTAKSLIIIIVALVAVLVAAIHFKLFDKGVAALIKGLVYYPDKTLVADPSAAGLAYQSIDFQAGDATPLHGWWIEGEMDAPAIILFHGNAGNISHRIYLAAELRKKLGVAIFLFDYRGFGRSEGEPFEAGLYADGMAAARLVKDKGWAENGLIYFGRSLGAAVALQTALDLAPDGLVLEAPFTSVREMGGHHYPLFKPPARFNKIEAYDSLEKAAEITSPLMVMHGRLDRIAPFEMGRKIFERSTVAKTFIELPNSDHEDGFITDHDIYIKGWREFLERFKN